MADWKIRRRLGECTRCETVFEEGDRHASLLRVDEQEDLLREDLCSPCFAAGDQDSFLFWWFTHYHENRSKALQLDLASLERLFLELDGRQETKLRELRYLLCLLLMRKRKLKLQKVKRHKDGEVLVLRRPRRQEEIEVWVFDFTPEQIEEMRSRLQEVLEGAGPTQEEAETTESDSAQAQEGSDEAELGEGPEASMEPADDPQSPNAESSQEATAGATAEESVGEGKDALEGDETPTQEEMARRDELATSAAVAEDAQ